jgi:Type IX secretion system protein PorV
MISTLTKISIPILAFCFLHQVANAQSGTDNPITTAVPFLRLSADARTAGMGDVGLATSPDANSMFYNGSKTAFNQDKFGVALTYTPWLKELDVKSSYQMALGSYYKLNDKEAISFGIRYFSLGSFTFTDNVGQEVSTFKPRDMAIEAGYSRKLSEKLGVGLNLRYINSRIADNSTGTNAKAGNSVAADLSAMYMLKKDWNVAIALTNLGGKINYGGTNSFIPATFAIGTAYTKNFNEENKLTFGLDITKLMVPTPPDANDPAKVAAYENKSVVSSWFSSFGDASGGGSEELKEFQMGLGAEYSYKSMFSIRTGYFSENKLKGNRNYFTAGAGIKYDVAGVNFSYLIPAGNNANTSALRNTFRVSVLFDMNNTKNSK